MDIQNDVRKDAADCTRQHDGDQAGLDRCFMAEALDQARGVKCRTWPNPPVGAVVAKNGVIVGRGAHEGCGSSHAEQVALAEAGALARGATLYVTLEPCNHQGRTPPCAPAVVAAGISRVVVGIRDPNPTVTGGGCRYLRERGMVVSCGVLANEALDLIWPFVATDNFSHAYVELKTAQSLDGWYAPPAGSRTESVPVYLSGEPARLDVHCRRRRLDLVLVGEETVRADRPGLDGRLAAGRHDLPDCEPVPGYVDTDLSWAGGFQRDKYLVFAGTGARDSAHRAAIEADGGEILFCRETGGHVDPVALCEVAVCRDLLTIMVEGGPRLAASFLNTGMVDRWVRYLTPRVLANGVGWPAGEYRPRRRGPEFSLTRHERLGEDLLVIHDRRNFADVLTQVTV
jgi:diaminohydroxyphosphoribosylaminopyrimidine deaminase/5-amino-6-(5-phosphoribosylamino)uracil reductase